MAAFRRPHQKHLPHGLPQSRYAIAFGAIAQPDTLSEVQRLFMMALVTKVASTAPASFRRAASAPEESADRWRRYPASAFRCELQLLTLLFAHQQCAKFFCCVADFSCSATESSLSTWVSWLAGPDVHPSWQQYRSPRTLPAVPPGDAFRELKYLNAGFQH